MNAHDPCSPHTGLTEEFDCAIVWLPSRDRADVGGQNPAHVSARTGWAEMIVWSGS